MKTRTDFEKMTMLTLREECKGKVKNYGKLTKDQMIDALVALTENSASVETEEVYTDRHNLPIVKNQRVSVRVGGKWFPGTIVRLKRVEGEDCASVLLDGKDLPKFFSSTDIDVDVPGDSKKATSTSTNKTESVVTEGVSEPAAKVSRKREIIPFTEEQTQFVGDQIKRYEAKELSKKELVVSFMEFGITKQQIDKFVDSSILHWSYVYDIYRAHGK